MLSLPQAVEKPDAEPYSENFDFCSAQSALLYFSSLFRPLPQSARRQAKYHPSSLLSLALLTARIAVPCCRRRRICRRPCVILVRCGCHICKNCLYIRRTSKVLLVRAAGPSRASILAAEAARSLSRWCHCLSLRRGSRLLCPRLVTIDAWVSNRMTRSIEELCKSFRYLAQSFFCCFALKRYCAPVFEMKILRDENAKVEAVW